MTDRQMNAKAFQALIKAAAELLPGTWTANPPRGSSDMGDTTYVQLVRPADGVQIGVSLDQYRRRINVSPDLPELPERRHHAQSRYGVAIKANLSPMRTPRAIAQEIERRVLQPYLEIFPQVLETITTECQSRERLHQMVAAMQQRYGDGAVSSSNNGFNSERAVIYPRSSVIRSLDLYEYGVASLTLHNIPFSQIGPILDALDAVKDEN